MSNKSCWKCGTIFDGVYTGQVYCPACRIIIALDEQSQRVSQQSPQTNTVYTTYERPERIITEPKDLSDYISEAFAWALIIGVFYLMLWPILSIFYRVFAE